MEIPVKKQEPAVSKPLPVRPNEADPTPLRLFIILIISIFIAEALIMFILSFRPTFSLTEEAFLDALLLSILVFPIIYFFSFKPLVREMGRRKQAYEFLQKSHDELETRVFERTQELTAANKSLQEKEERFCSLVQSSGDAIILADLNGNIILWNKGAQIIFGYSAEEVLSKNITLLMPERYIAAHRQGLIRLNQTGKSRVLGRTLELAGLRKDGTEFPLELSLDSWQTEQGRFFSGIIRDISVRKKIESEREKLLRELQEALANIKTLKGLIPICVSCKKIRDDKGFWQKVESYIESYSEAEFTHGYCPACAERIKKEFLENETKT